MNQKHITTANLHSELLKWINNRTIGSDYFVDMINEANQAPQSNYPPYNLVRTGDDTYELSLAVAGFTKQNITVAVHDRSLVIKGHVEGDSREPEDYIVRGIGLREFVREFKLFEYIEVQSAELKDGMLRVELKREVPEAAKPKMIPLS